jgi:predicted AAA+ superfamily ATPase
MDNFKEFIENNKLNYDILSYYSGHEAIKGCKAGKNDINSYVLVINNETNEKYYVVDLGLKNITATNKYDTDLGHKLENVVYFELLRRGGKIYVGKHNDKEIDFVVQKPNNEREYYQVAFTVNNEKTFKREISSFRNIKDNYPKYLLTLDYDNTSIDGIQKLNVVDWLLQ